MPELTVLVELGGREIEMREPTDGALVIMARVGRGVPRNGNIADISEEMRDRLVRNLGTLGKVIEGMIVKDDDKDWLDDAMIDGDVTAEEVLGAIRKVGEKINGSATPAKKAAAATVRRRR